MPLPPAWCSSRVFTSQRGKVSIEAECPHRVISGLRDASPNPDRDTFYGDTPYSRSDSGTGARVRLMVPRRRLVSRRRVFDARGGRVLRRGLGGSAALRTRAVSRARASARFLSRVRNLRA